MRNWRENMCKGLGSRPDYWLMLKKSESLPILGSVLNTHLSKCCQKSHHTHTHAYIDSTQPYPYCRQPASYMLHISTIASHIDQCKLSKGCTLSCKGLASTALIFSFFSICKAILPSLSMLPPEPRLLVSSASDYHHCPAGREKQSQTQVLMTLKYSSLSEFSFFFPSQHASFTQQQTWTAVVSMGRCQVAQVGNHSKLSLGWYKWVWNHLAVLI